MKMKAKLKELTSRSNGWGYEIRKQKLKNYIREWMEYYHLAQIKRLCVETDEWLRRRIRMCIWKSWKKVKTRVANLKKCGALDWQAYQWGLFFEIIFDDKNINVWIAISDVINDCFYIFPIKSA